MSRTVPNIVLAPDHGIISPRVQCGRPGNPKIGKLVFASFHVLSHISHISNSRVIPPNRAPQSLSTMGSVPSKPAQHVNLKTESINEKSDKPAPSISCPPASADGSLSLKSVSDWEAAAAASAKTRLARAILSHSNLNSALVRREPFIADAHVFNTELDFKTGPITNQKSSGRCWLFATTNVLRYEIMKKLNLKEFQLSQARYHCIACHVINAEDACSPICFSGISSTRPITTLSCQFRKLAVRSMTVLLVTSLAI